MCYSAMVKRDLDKIAREFGAAIDTDAFIRLYMAREKDLSLKIPYGMDRYFIEKGGATGRTIEKSIKAYKVMEDARKKQELEDLEAEIKEIEARLKVKVTKTHQKALDVKGRKREKLLAKAESAVATSETKDSYRIYPFYFSPVIMVEKTARIITPMRYRILPRTGVEIPSKYNVFNARRDSLLEARTWKQTFSKQHAIFPFVKFYEWVEQKARKVEMASDAADTLLKSDRLHVGHDRSIWLMGEKNESAMEFREEPNGQWRGKRHGKPSGAFFESFGKGKQIVVHRDPFEFILQHGGRAPSPSGGVSHLVMFDAGSHQRLDELLATNRHISEVHLAHSARTEERERDRKVQQKFQEHFNPFDIHVQAFEPGRARSKSRGPDFSL